MRTRVIPAQITTVEDKIAGNLNLTQIIILITPVFLATAIYAIFPPSMELVLYKIILTLIIAVICIVLSLRIKGKIVANWLVVLARFNARPRYYVFDKNEVYLRDLYLPETDKAQARAESKKKVTATEKKTTFTFNFEELLYLENLLSNKNANVRFKRSKKGGLSVAFEQVTK